MTAVNVTINLPDGATDNMIFAFGSNVEDVEDKIRQTVNLVGGTIELNGITCLKGQTLGSIGTYTFNRGIPQAPSYLDNSRKRSFEDMQVGGAAAITDTAEAVRKYIDLVLCGDDARSKGNDFNGPKSNRPENWRLIAEHAVVNGNQATINLFPELCNDKFGMRCKSATIEMRLLRWIKDYNTEIRTNEAIVINHGGRKPVYGEEVDNALLHAVKAQMDAGVNVDANVLHEMLVAELTKADLTHLLRGEGGSCTFGLSWAQRFFNRHGLKAKSAQSKKVRPSGDTDEKLWTFESSLAVAVSDHNIPPSLVFSMDEIPIVFSPGSSRVKTLKTLSPGIPMLGITKDKTQVTTTMLVNEAGFVFPPQLIISGTTDRCHPKDAAPYDGFYSHSPSHWQTAETMINWIDFVLVPAKNTEIAIQGLSPEQRCVLILDLHFSHKDPTVVQHLRAHGIIPVFLPSKFAEELQVIEMACKNTFQQAAKARFRMLTQEQFEQHLESGRHPLEFALNFNVGYLKPLIPRCIESAMEAMHTPEMKMDIMTVFAKQGCMEVCRSEARVAAARAARIDVQIPTEVEGDPAAGDSDSEDE